MNATQIRTLVEGHVRILLGLDSDTRVDGTQTFVSLGMDSLLGIEFRKRIRKDLKVTDSKAIPMAMIFKYPTPNVLVEFLSNMTDSNEKKAA